MPAKQAKTDAKKREAAPAKKPARPAKGRAAKTENKKPAAKEKKTAAAPASRAKKAATTTAGETPAAYTYIVRCADGTLYTGWTNDLEKRVKAHNDGRGAKYTHARRPVTLVYSEALPTKAAALRREAAGKKLTRAQKLALSTAKND
jgi:putative endonuclease